MRDDWFDSDDDRDEEGQPIPRFKVVNIAYAEPALFSLPHDPSVKRIQEFVDSRFDSYGVVWARADTVRGNLDVLVQHPALGEEQSHLALQMEQNHLQLSLFSEHPEIQISSPSEDLLNSVMDLVGAIVIERSDVRETTLVADMVGLLRRHGSPVNLITDMALAVFDVILSIAASREMYLWDAHEFYLGLISRG